MSISYIGVPKIKAKNLLQMTKDDIIDAINNAEDYEVVGNILTTFRTSFTNQLLNDSRIDVGTLIKILFGNGMDFTYINLIFNDQSTWPNIKGPGNHFPSQNKFNRWSEVVQYVINNYSPIDVLNLPSTLIIESGSATFENNILDVDGGTSYVAFDLNYNLSNANTFLIYIDYDVEGVGAYGISILSALNSTPYAQIDFGGDTPESPQQTVSYGPLPPKTAVVIVLPSEADTFTKVYAYAANASGNIKFKLHKLLLYPIGKVLATGPQFNYGMIGSPIT